MNGPYEEFARCVDLGNHNLAVRVFAASWDRLSSYERTDGLLWLKRFISHGGYLTSDTLDRLERAVPEKVLKDHGLPGILESCHFSPCMELPSGCSPCLCVGEEGCIRDIRIFEANSSQTEHQILLDSVGRILFRVIENVFGLSLLWNPYVYDFMTLQPFGREDPSVKGDSMGLALALALCSYVFNVPLPGSLAASAALGPDGRLRSVEGLSKKLEALERERDYVQRVIVAESQRDLSQSGIELVPAGSLEDVIKKIWPGSRALQASTLPLAELDVESELQRLNRLYDDYLIDSCTESSERLISHLRSDRCRMPREQKLRALFTCYWRRASCRTHKGQPLLAEKDLKQARNIYCSHPGVISKDTYLSMAITRGVLLKDLFLFDQAEKLHREIDEEIRSIGGLNHEKGKNLSAWSQLMAACGRYAEAEEHQKKAVQLVDESDRHRNLNYLAQVYVHWGKYPKAKATVAHACELFDQQPRRRNRDLPFIHLVEANLHYRWGKTLKKAHCRKLHLEVVHDLASRYADPEAWWYVPALINKLHAQALLLENHQEEGIACLDRAIRHFEAQPGPVLKILAASARATRALCLLENGDMQGALKDLNLIVALLAAPAPIEAFFRQEIKQTDKLISASTVERPPVEHVNTLLRSILRKTECVAI